MLTDKGLPCFGRWNFGLGNGAPGRIRTCDPRLRRPDVGIGYTKTVIFWPPSPAPMSSIQAKNRPIIPLA